MKTRFFPYNEISYLDLVLWEFFLSASFNYQRVIRFSQIQNASIFILYLFKKFIRSNPRKKRVQIDENRKTHSWKIVKGQKTYDLIAFDWKFEQQVDHTKIHSYDQKIDLIEDWGPGRRENRNQRIQQRLDVHYFFSPLKLLRLRVQTNLNQKIFATFSYLRT